MITDIEQLDLTKTYTTADYLQWRFQERVELIWGQLFKMSPAPSSRHQIISGSLHSIFWNYLKNKSCKVFAAPFDVYLPTENKNTVVQPDLCVICDPAKIQHKGCVGSPDLVIEILSPGNSRKEMREKYDLYEACGVLEYWVVFIEEQIVQRYQLDQRGVYQAQKPNVTGDVVSPLCLAGLGVAVEEVFE